MNTPFKPPPSQQKLGGRQAFYLDKKSESGAAAAARVPVSISEPAMQPPPGCSSLTPETPLAGTGPATACLLPKGFEETECNYP